MFTSKKELKKQIQNLYEIYENLKNFDDIYLQLKKQYQDTKKLIDENNLLNDKKELRNNSLIDEKINDFRTNMERLINELNTDKIEWLKNVNEITDNIQKEIATKSMEQLNRINESNNEQLIKIQDESMDFKNKLLNNQTEILGNKIEELTNKVESVLNEYKINLAQMIDMRITSEIFKQSIEEVSKKATQNILDSFNRKLADMKQPEAQSIIDAITKMLNEDLKLMIDNDTEREPVAELDKNELFHSEYNKLKTIISSSTAKDPVIPMLVGPAGTGKSTAAEQMAKDLKLHFYLANRIQNTFELVGFVDAAGNYVTTQFYEAFTKGGLFLFDEVDASSPEALVTINAAVAQGYMAFPGKDKNVLMHPDFKVICAGNTYGTGSTLQYTGRNKLDAATLDRFMIIEWGYDRDLEDKRIKDKDLLNICWSLREESAVVDETIIISTRGIITLEQIIEKNKKEKSFKIEDLIRQKFFASTDKDDLKTIVSSLKNKLNKNPYYKYLELL